MDNCTVQTETTPAESGHRISRRNILVGAAAAGLAAVIPTVARAQQGPSLPRGKWKIDANNFLGELDIQSVDGSGNLVGTVFNDNFLGFWDETAQKITFMRIIDP